ncbi:MerR family transcriptional regulator [Aquibacillus koreensis]|uniref:MerR family transcriptional regulator n=1 Tax=Aquibacillus koreensis TaxID=279446 RepID=A0A9X4AID9_9BACI|nr:MerR family transcriptional regulator [Aquibacillus koreensis]MCT2535198.1 MerR family transcriptional regulator [Aquibacillus koreensis]MDC3421057.1 MerR family transcriptional regulator [Aquibacillus koreensis]
MLRIGELAELSNVSKRTIDYYTKIGLLQCKRSESNYRYYSEESMEELKFIEQCKKMHLTLDDIKQKKSLMDSNQMDQEAFLTQVNLISNKIDFLQNEIKAVYANVGNLEEKERAKILDNLKPKTVALIQSLIMLTT